MLSVGKLIVFFNKFVTFLAKNMALLIQKLFFEASLIQVPKFCGEAICTRIRGRDGPDILLFIPSRPDTEFHIWLDIPDMI